MKAQNNKFRYASDKSLKEKLEIWFIKDHKKGKLVYLTINKIFC